MCNFRMNQNIQNAKTYNWGIPDDINYACSTDCILPKN